jgi:hypothetical protein
VVFEVECIDRMYCNVYVPGLQYAAGLVAYVHRQLELPVASGARFVLAPAALGVLGYERDTAVVERWNA